MLTRRQLLAHLAANGFPIGKGTIDRLCSPAVGGGPPVVGWWGNRALYDPDASIAWARARLRLHRRLAKADEVTDLSDIVHGEQGHGGTSEALR